MPSRVLFKSLGSAFPRLRCACRLIDGYNSNFKYCIYKPMPLTTRIWLALIFSMLVKRDRLIGGEKMPPCHPCIIVDWFL